MIATPISNNSKHRTEDPTRLQNRNSESDENLYSSTNSKFADGTWNEGQHDNSPASMVTRVPAAMNEVLIDQEISAHPSAGNEYDDSDADTARASAGRMNTQDPSKQTQSLRSADGDLWQMFSAKNCTYCCAAGSITLLGLSVACFTLPSISSYAAERTAVQAVGYTGGILSLLFGIGTGLYVKSVYSQPDQRIQ